METVRVRKRQQLDVLEIRSDHGSLLHPDYISNLPLPIIHHILSFVSHKSILRTATLSKSWYNFSSSMNCLVFSHSYSKYLQKKAVEGDAHQPGQGAMLRSFLDAVDDDVGRRFRQIENDSTNIHAFRMHISVPNTKLLTPRLDLWLSAAIEKNVSEVFLTVLHSTRPISSSNWYSVPDSLLVAPKLTSLEMCFCQVQSNSFAELLSLRKLVLSFVFLSNNFMFHNLSTCCPLIAHIELVRCRGLKKLVSGSSLTQLDYLKLDACYGLKTLHVEAPILRTFQFISDSSVKCNIDLGCSSTLKDLTLCAVNITSESFEKLLHKNPFIEHLKLKKCGFLSRLEIYSSTLKSLILRECSRLKVAKVKAPGLVLVDHDNPQIIFTLMKYSSLRKIRIQLDFAGHDIQWWCELKEYLKDVHFFKELKFALKSCKKKGFSFEEHQDDVIIHDELSDVSFSALTYLEELNPVVCISSMSYAEILDDFFESMRPRILSFVCPSRKVKSVVEEILEHFSRRPEHKSWHHACRGVEVEAMGVAEDEVCQPFVSFLRSHSSTGYQTTAIRIKW